MHVLLDYIQIMFSLCQHLLNGKLGKPAFLFDALIHLSTFVMQSGKVFRIVILIYDDGQ